MKAKIILGVTGFSSFISGLLGVLLLGPTRELSLLKNSFWMNYFEIYSFLTLGFLGIAGFYMLSDKSVIKWLAIIIMLLVAVIVYLRISQILPS